MINLQFYPNPFVKTCLGGPVGNRISNNIVSLMTSRFTVVALTKGEDIHILIHWVKVEAYDSLVIPLLFPCYSIVIPLLFHC
jgi:hypothetical protein